jgi:hypothetical protein
MGRLGVGPQIASAIDQAAARLAPKKYGDRVEHDVKGGVHFQPQILIQCSRDREDEQVKIATHHEPSELQ